MADFQVPDPILNSPYEEPSLHWWIEDGSPPQQREGRRPAMYFYRDPKTRSENQGRQGGEPVELKLVNQIRDLVATWRHQGCPGASRTTHELLSWWRREGREKRLFFAQIEAVETIIFLREARSDFLQGVDIPRDEPNDSQKAEGAAGFLRYASKLATGSGKTTVMGMLAAWSILNKVNDRADARFSDVVLVVCPNVTIRQRLAELDPNLGDASLYRTRDLVPEHLMKLLRQGKVVITNWHVFEPHVASVGGQGGRVVKAGQPVETRERIHVGEQNTTARGKRYLTLSTLEMMTAAQQLEILAGSEKRDEVGNLISVEVRSTKYVESDSAVIARVLGREVGGKQNILVMNDEAHHAYRIRRDEPDEEEDDEFGEDEEADEFYKEATIWVDGLDRVQKLRGVNFCVDLSATPYFLGRVGQNANRPFPWVVSDFGLIDAIESGLVKIPQLAIRDSTGAAVVGAEDKVPSYFNIWHWILPKLTPAERGGKRSNPKPEAILKYAHTPIAMLGGLWEETAKEWAESGSEPRPPVFIIICKNTALAKVFFEWIAHEVCPTGIPPLRVDGFRNREGNHYTIRVDSKVVHETDTGGAKNDASRWMRFTLDTVGKLAWPRDRQGREVMPEGFEELAKKMEKPLHPPGRDVRCIVSVGMLTEGWDCNTVTHIVGLRPFMSQLLCEQVVGRGLRRASYEPGVDGKLPEEVAKVFGVPFEVIPFKANKGGAPLPPSKRIHVRAVAEKERFALTFPRVDGYTQAIRNRVVVDWKNVPTMTVDPTSIPPEVQMKGLHAASNTGRPTLGGPGRISDVSLKEFRTRHRLQELVFELARELTKSYLSQPGCTVPAHVLFPQCASIVQRYVDTKVTALAPADIKDLFLAPYYGWLVERLTQAIRPDTASGEEPEIPRYEVSRGPGSTAEVSFFTSRDVREGQRCHLNFSVLDTGKWEQSAVYFIDTHPAVEAFVKNAGLGFAVPYFHNGQPHDYVPDFIVKLSKPEPLNLIVETKGYDPLQEVKADAAKRWCDAVNADNRFGKWRYALCKGPLEVRTLLDGIMLGNA